MTASLSNGLFAKDTLLLGSRDGYPEIRQLLQERLRDIVALFNTAGKETMTVLNIEAACDAIYVRPNLNILVPVVASFVRSMIAGSSAAVISHDTVSFWKPLLMYVTDVRRRPPANVTMPITRHTKLTHSTFTT